MRVIPALAFADRYDIIWDGAHNGTNDDLLTPFRSYRAYHPKAHHYKLPRELVWAVLGTNAAQALSFREVVTLTGCSERAVNGILYRMQGEGTLASAIGMPRGIGGAVGHIYWRRA